MKVENPEKGYKIKFGGRINLDALSDWPEHKGVIDTLIKKGSRVEFRRIRFFSAGQIYPNILYKLQFDFARGSALLKGAGNIYIFQLRRQVDF